MGIEQYPPAPNTAGVVTTSGDQSISGQKIFLSPLAASVTPSTSGSMFTDSGVNRLVVGNGTTGLGYEANDGHMLVLYAGDVARLWTSSGSGGMTINSGYVYHQGGFNNDNRMIFTRSSGYQHGFKFRTGSSDRWDIFVSSDAESGSNAGSDLKISRYSDASGWLGDPWVLSRATGEMSARESLSVFPNASGNIALKVLGASGQTADLQQWQNNSGTPLSYITAGGGLVLVAGTTTLAPLRLQSGTNLTSATGGAFEYDGKVKYFTPNSSATAGRALDRSEHLLVSGADLTLSNATGVQSLFAAANDTITVPASTSYYFECEFHQTGTGTTSHTLNFALGGTLTTHNIQYQAYVVQNATGSATPTPTAHYGCYIATAASTAITAATATAIYRSVRIRGVIRVNASGTLIPQVAFSAAPGVAPVIKSGASFKLIPIGSAAASTANVVGGWS